MTARDYLILKCWFCYENVFAQVVSRFFLNKKKKSPKEIAGVHRERGRGFIFYKCKTRHITERNDGGNISAMSAQ